MQSIPEQEYIFTEIYDSAERPHPFLDEFLALIKYKDLVLQFVSRAIKTRYKRSVLGVVWTMLNPLMTMIVITLVFSQVFRFDIENFPVYFLCGQMTWNFFATSTSMAMGDMVWSGGLLNRIYIPKSVFAVSAVGAGLVNLLITLVPLLIIALVLSAKLSWALLTWPLTIFLMALFSLGVGLILATAAVYFADMLPVYDVVLTIWMYGTPIFYPIEIVPQHWRWLFKLNPMYHYVNAFRLPLLNQEVPSWDTWLPAIGFALVSIIVGWLLFTAKSNEYAYRT